MKSKFQFIKNIIFVVASALTLVAVTFSWFSTSNTNGVPSMTMDITDDVIDTAFYEKIDTEYVELDGDITLDSVVSGEFNEYKMIISTNTSEPVKLSVCIDNLPEDLDEALKENVCIKYSLYKTTANPDGTYTDGQYVTGSNFNYVPLSELADGVIFGGYSLGAYQETDNDYFALYYEIGLSYTAGNDVQGLTSDLGSLRLSAQIDN